LAKAFSVLRPAKFNPHIEAFRPAPFSQRLAEDGDPVTSILIFGRYRHKHANATHSGFLGARSGWPHRSDAAKENNHIASAHGLGAQSITKSAFISTAGQHGWKGHCGKEVCGALNAQEREQQLHALI
jgi:hypothetical protein